MIKIIKSVFDDFDRLIYYRITEEEIEFKILDLFKAFYDIRFKCPKYLSILFKLKNADKWTLLTKAHFFRKEDPEKNIESFMNTIFANEACI